MKPKVEPTAPSAPAHTSTLHFHVADVTGTREMDVEVAADTPTGAVAKYLAEQMQLPSNVPWALRDDRGGFLDDARQAGEQIAHDARISIVPRVHLG